VVFDLVDTKTNECVGRAVLADSDPDGWVLLSNPKERTVGGNGWLFVAMSFSKMEYQAEKHMTNMYSQNREGVLDERRAIIQSRPVAKDGFACSIIPFLNRPTFSFSLSLSLPLSLPLSLSLLPSPAGTKS